MLESTKRESSEAETAADSDATSKETVRDLEENEEDVTSDGSKRDPGPSPDGTLDKSDEKNDAGPM